MKVRANLVRLMRGEWWKEKAAGVLGTPGGLTSEPRHKRGG
jgi:hypothetical protein